MSIHFKRFLACIGALLMLFSFAACDAGDNNNGDGTQSPSEVSDTGVIEGSDDYGDGLFYEKEFSLTASVKQNFLETEDCLYIAKDGYLYYSDKTYHEWLPLCGKPECTHRNKNCNANIGPYKDYYTYMDEPVSIGLYGSHIYFVTCDTSKFTTTPLTLCRMRLDGSQHEELLEIRRPDGEYRYNEHTEELYLDYFCGKYMCYTYYPYGSGNNLEEVGGMYAIDLSDLEKEHVKLDYSFGIEEVCNNYYPLAQIGDVMYSCVTRGAERLHTFFIGAQNLSTGESYLVSDKFEGQPWASERDFVYDGNELRFWTTDLTTFERWMYRLNPETGELKYIAYDNITKEWIASDPHSGYIYGCIIPGSMFGGDWRFCVFDLDGNDIWRIGEEVLPEGLEFLILSFISEDYLFFDEINDGGRYNRLPEWYVEKSSIGTDDFEFKLWEP